MEISDVRRRVTQAITRAKGTAAAKRTRVDEAAAEYSTFLEQKAIPLIRQVANVLKAENYAFTVFTPGGGVKLSSDRNADDFIELFLDTSGEEPAVVGRSRRSRGGRVVERERPLAPGPVRDVTEDAVLEFVLQELEPLVER